MKSWRCMIGLGLLVVMGGCANQAPPPSPAPTAADFPFDGSYVGTVKVTGVASGGDIKWCDTDPNITFTVSNGTFGYTQPHPNVPFTAGTGNTTAVYSGSIAMDGTVRGQSQSGGVMSGTASGKHIAGKIDGVGCFYTFAADKT